MLMIVAQTKALHGWYWNRSPQSTFSQW